MNPIRISLLALFVSAALAAAENEPVVAQRPNILFIMADDHTTQAISPYQGFPAEYAATGISIGWRRRACSSTTFLHQFTVQSALRRSGYETGLFGKWHLKSTPDGFDDYKATHDPWASRPPYDTLWEGEDLPEPPNLHDEYDGRTEVAKRTTLKLEMMNQAG